MQLVYRGITYTLAENTVEPSVKGITAKFRGQIYALPRPIKLHTSHQHTLVYRGISSPHL